MRNDDLVPSDLPKISADIKAAWTTAKDHQVAALEGYLRVGHLLDKARRELPANADYGAWFEAENFEFSRQWAVRLRQLARHEAEVRALSATAVSDGLPAPGVNRLLELLSGRPASTSFDTEVADAPTSVTIPATIEEAAIRLAELDDEDRRYRAEEAALRAWLEVMKS